MDVKRINYYSWFLNVFAWDGMLPAFIVFLPFVIHYYFPQNRGAIEIMAVVLPITGFFIRFYHGKRCIFSNNCRPIFRRFQFCIFCFGIFCLVLIDAILVLFHILPNEAFNVGDFIISGAMYFVYLLSMVIAMFPGRVLTGNTGFQSGVA